MVNYDRIIAQKERELAALYDQQQRAEKIAERFGEDDYADGSILYWERTFTPGQKTYHYTGLKIGSLWFITGSDRTALLWPALVEKHLAHADCVWFVTEMTEVE